MTPTVELVVRWVPGQEWVRLFLSLERGFRPGHAWIAAGLVRRDAWKVGPVGFGVLRMPVADRSDAR